MPLVFDVTYQACWGGVEICRSMGKPRLESVEEVMGEGPTWDRKQLDEMELEFRK